MPRNPLSIPGSWGQESETQKEDEREHSQPEATDAVPRNAAAAGVVNKSGEIVDDSGKVIGKISDSKDGQDLVGNAVTAAGDVVSDSGDVLAKASLDSEYTTQPAKGEAKPGGWNLLGKTKGAIGAAGNIRKPVGDTLEFAGKLGQNQRGRTDEKQAEGAPDSAQADTLGEKHSTDADTSRQDTSANVSERTSAKDPAETPTSSTHGDHPPHIQLKDNEASTGTKAKDEPRKSSPAQKTQEKSKSAACDVKDSKSDVSAPVEDKVPDEPMTMKSPAPIDEADDKAPSKDADSKEVTDQKAADTKQVGDQRARESSEQAVAKGSCHVAGETSDQTTDTTTERGRSVGATDEAPGEAAASATDEATERASSAKPVEQASSEQDLVGQVQEHAEDVTEPHAPQAKGDVAEQSSSEQGLEQATNKAPAEGSGETSGRATEQVTSEHPAEHAFLSRTQSQSPTSASVEKDPAADAGTKAELEPETADEAKAKTEGEVDKPAALGEPDKQGEQGPESVGDDAGKDLKQEKDGAEPVDKVEEEGERLPIDYSILKGAKVNETGDLVDSNDKVIGRLLEGDAKQLLGKTADESGKFSDESGKVIGRAEPFPEHEQQGDEDDEQQPADLNVLEGAKVNKAGNVVNSDGDVVGRLVEGDAKQLFGNKADESGNFLDDKGRVIGRAELVPEEEAEAAQKEEESESTDTNILKGAKVNKAGNVVDGDGDIVGRLVEGDAKQLLGKQADESGNFLDGKGNVIGRAEPIPDEEPEAAQEEEPEAVQEEEPEAAQEKEPQGADIDILKGAKVNKAGNVVDADGDIVGRLVEGDAKQLLGKQADESGNFRDESGKIIGRAEPLTEEEEQEQQEPIDYSILKGSKVNKAGNLVDKNGDVIGRLVEGDVKHLLGKTADESGNLWNESGKIIGRAEPVPEDERTGAKDFAPFENFPDATVESDGRVMSGGRQVGTVTEGDHKRLKGSRVDEDGDILDRRGNVVGKAEAWDEPEPEVEAEADRSLLAGKRVNKAGNVVDSAGVIYGRVIEGNVASLVGRMCNKEGNVMSESGEVIGKAELVPEHEREGSRDGPFAELVGCTVTKDGKVVTGAGDVVGRLTSGDGKALFGRPVDEGGDVLDRNGNVLGKAERWEEPEVEKRRDPLAGRRVNREGNIVDEDGNLLGKLTSGDLAICSGKEVDEDGDVVNSKGTTIGHVSLLEDIPQEPEPEPEPEVETESAEEKQVREQAEKDQKLAGQLSSAVGQSLDKIRPICKMITDKIDSAERKPKEELDEEQLVKEVKPLIEEGHRVLTETNGVIRGLDPDGRIQRNAKHKAATRDASPEEHHLAESLKELTGTVSQTIENAQRKIEGMPHAKKELNPLWGLLTEPLFQILAAVGLLLNGVLGLVGQLLSGLGLGGIVDKLLGGLGLNKILGSLGLGDALSSLTGKKKK